MFDYQSIKALAKVSGRSVKDLLALSQINDPFYAGVGHRAQAAEWFGNIWHQYSGVSPHLRRIHYRLVSPPEGVRILLPNGRQYQNTENDWTFLCGASLAARYLDRCPFDGLIDRRNSEPIHLAGSADPEFASNVSCSLYGGDVDVDLPDFPSLPSLDLDGFQTVQNFILDVWIEKSTQNDWLDPLCRRRGVNLVVGIGEQSETRSRELAFRAARQKAPVRVFYLSDFDPGGRSMPKAVARKVEFTIAKFGLNVDIQVIPLVLTPEQCREYKLPRTPIKDTERRKDKFERIFGVGATELDALEALHPGEMARLLEAEIDNFLDRDLGQRVRQEQRGYELFLNKIENRLREKHSEKIRVLEESFDDIVASLQEWEEEAQELWSAIKAELNEQKPDLSGVEVPRPKVSGKTDRFVLFDSKRDYFTQLDYYHMWQDGGEE
jgi:hypothetical protein